MSLFIIAAVFHFINGQTRSLINLTVYVSHVENAVMCSHSGHALQFKHRSAGGSWLLQMVISSLRKMTFQTVTGSAFTRTQHPLQDYCLWARSKKCVLVFFFTSSACYYQTVSLSKKIKKINKNHSWTASYWCKSNKGFCWNARKGTALKYRLHIWKQLIFIPCKIS